MGSPRKQRDGAEGSSNSPRPLNTGTICLDGEDGYQSLPSYCGGIDAILDWLRDAETPLDVSHLFGPNAKVIRTRRGGTFHMMIEYDSRALEILIAGRDLYIMGWRGPNGSYEIKSDRQEENYMLGTVKTVNTGLNYSSLSPNRKVGDTRLGIYAFRQAFDELYNYKGGSPGEVQAAVGRISVLLSEATRLQCVFDAVCASFTDVNISRLRDLSEDPLWVKRWSHYSGEGLEQIDHMMSGKQPPPIKLRGINVKSAEDIFRQIRVFHRDSHNKGRFVHEDPPDLPIFEVPVGASEESDGSSNNRKKGKHGEKRSGKANKKQKKILKGGKEAPASLLEDSSSRRSYSSSPPASPDPVFVQDSSSQPTDCSSSVSSDSSLVEDWLDQVKHNSEAQSFLSSPRWGDQISNTLRHWGTEVSECMTHFPALRRRLCGSKYKTKNRWKTPWSFRSSVDRIAGEQKWKTPWSIQSSADRSSCERKPRRTDSHPSVNKAITTAPILRNNLATPETNLTPPQKRPIHPTTLWRRACSLISKFLRLR